MKLFSLNITVNESYEEIITRLCYEETNSPTQIEYKENNLINIILTGSESFINTLIEKIKIYIKDFFDNKIEINFDVKEIEEHNWNEKWKSEFECIEIDKKLVIKPYFKEYTGKINNIITINPSIGFGSGEHPTTKLMLKKLINMDLNKKTILDIGSGSGILSIASLNMGANESTMIEIDPDAGKNSEENFKLNYLENKFQLFAGDFAEISIRKKINKKFDIILMNILPNIILKLVPYINDFTHPTSQVIFSGIIESRAEELKASIQRYGFSIKKMEKMENWMRFDTTIM